MTVEELKEMALSIGGISGVTAMKKEELAAAIRQAGASFEGDEGGAR